jgi:hypothetical protein
MLSMNVADIQVTHRTIEVPETCPACGASLAAWNPADDPPVRELNLTASNFFGRFAADSEHAFQVDPRSGEEHPSDAIWIAYGYECVRCGELIATGTVEAE